MSEPAGRPGSSSSTAPEAATGGHATHAVQESGDVFEPTGWDARYSGDELVWSGRPNPQLVDVASGLVPGTAVDVGCGEGGDVLWLARNGWQVTGADFSAKGLARAAAHLDEAGLGDRADWWQVDARELEAGDRQFDLVTTHYLHLPDGGTAGAVARLCGLVAPGGHLLVVGHAPSEALGPMSPQRRAAMFVAQDLLPAVPDGMEVLVAEQRPRTVVRDGAHVDLEDAVLLVRRVRVVSG